jgi:hypothetical protein
MQDAPVDPGAPGGPDDPPAPGAADPFLPAWRVVAVAGVLVVVAFGVGWAALAHGGDDVTVPGSRGAAGRSTPDSDGGPTDGLPPSQPASPVSFGPDGTVVRPAPVLARVVDPSSGAVVVVPLPAGKTVDVHTGRIVPVDPTTTEPGSGTTTTTTHHHGGGTTTTVTEPPTTEDTTTTTEDTTTSTEDTTTSIPDDTTVPDTTDTVP